MGAVNSGNTPEKRKVNGIRELGLHEEMAHSLTTRKLLNALSKIRVGRRSRRKYASKTRKGMVEVKAVQTSKNSLRHAEIQDKEMPMWTQNTAEFLQRSTIISHVSKTERCCYSVKGRVRQGKVHCIRT